MLQHHRVILLTQLALKGFARRHQLIPGFREGDAGFFPGFVVKVEHPGGNGNRDTVEFAIDRGGLQLFGIELAEVDDILHFVQIVETLTVLREDRQPVPVCLHHVRLGSPGDSGGQARKMAVPAGISGFNVDVRILFMKLLQRFQGDLMAAVAAPP